jgi:predicted  nucleic acid-binding Zn-ribbon protein
MKCEKCGFENKDKAKFCTKCGNSLVQKVPEPVPAKSNNSKYIIIALIAVIILLVGTIGYFALNNGSESVETNDEPQNDDSAEVQSVDDSNEDSDDDDDVQTTAVSSSKTSVSSESDSKSWESIGSYSGSGSGSMDIDVPEGRIMVKLSAYPIKNYATNHLYVDGSNGAHGGVDWGSKSAVETRSDSFEYTSSSEETFTIDYYETVSWEVEFYRYQ